MNLFKSIRTICQSLQRQREHFLALRGLRQRGFSSVDFDPISEPIEKTLLAMKGERRNFASLQIQPEVIARNTMLMRPVALEFAQGDPQAEKFYRRAKIIHWDALPIWAKKYINEQVVDTYKHGAKELNLAVLKCYRACANPIVTKNPNQSDTNKQLLRLMGLTCVSTAWHLTKVLELTSDSLSPDKAINWFSDEVKSTLASTDKLAAEWRAANTLSKGVAVPVPEGLQKFAFDDLTFLFFSPTNPYQYGRMAHKLLDSLIPKIISACVIEDLCTGLNIPLKEAKKRELLHSITPENICDHPAIKNLFALSAIFEEFQCSNEERKTLTRTYIDSQPAAIERLRSRLNVSSKKKSVDPQITINLEALMAISAKGLDSTKLSAASKQDYPRLARLIRKGVISFETAARALELGAPPADIMNNEYSTVRAQRRTSSLLGKSRPDNSGDSNSGKGNSDSGRQPLPEVSCFMIGNRSPIKKWLKEFKIIHASHHAPLMRKIEALKQGHPRPDVQMIQSIKKEKIFELSHAGFSVYFRYVKNKDTKATDIQLLLGGTKDEWDEDVATLTGWFC